VTTAVAGLDLSLTGLGLVVVPSDWDLDFGRVRRTVLHTKPNLELVDRIAALAADACEWLAWARNGKPLEVWVEGSITGGRMGNSVRSQLKLAGVVEHEIRRQLGVVARTAEQSSARKLLLGYVPPKNRKEHVVEALKLLTPTAWDGNEYDALTTANYGLHELAAPCLSGLLGERPQTKSKNRRRLASKEAA
jgi:hypothetical protein